jgi:murein DD-endopeptidase MepM/ murein hydrolase activator NlpD
MLFKQLSDSIAQSHAAEVNIGLRQAETNNGVSPSFPDLVLFRYIVPDDIDIFSIAARINLPYETIATLNRIGIARMIRRGETIIVPSVTGVFIPENPENDLEFLMFSGRASKKPESVVLDVWLDGRKEIFYFFPGSRFHQAERAFFLNIQFRFPLPKKRVTSGFGLRKNPISGFMEMHQGIDLAAPLGTDVFASRAGTAIEIGKNSILGNYIVISHEGGWETVYGHLSVVEIRLNQIVKSGMIIGKVGSSGISTGPHLHFEVRLRGTPRDPANVLPRKYP